jgi:hypothetical protein
MIDKRVTADVDGEFVVFVIGMRVNSLWKVHRWLPVAAAMPRMLRELAADADSGLLGYETTVGWRTIVLLQYWESFDKLRAYARDDGREHLPAWVRYNRSQGDDGAVGIFHETYLIGPDGHESVYNNMPAFGLGAAAGVRPAEGDDETAGRRLGVVADEPAVDHAGRPAATDAPARHPDDGSE